MACSVRLFGGVRHLFNNTPRGVWMGTALRIVESSK